MTTASVQAQLSNQQFQSQLNSISSGSRAQEEAELRETCDEVESIFVKMMLDSMRSTLNGSGLIEKNQAEEMFEDELYSEYAKSITKTANLGISDAMFNQLSGQLPVL